MFADSMLETSWAQRTRRSWTTFTSFGLQALVIGLLLLLPLLKTVGLPSGRTVSTPVSIGQPAGEPPAPRPHNAAPSAARNDFSARLVAPGRVPSVIRRGADDSSSPVPDGIGTGIWAPLPGGGSTGLPMSLISGTRPLMPLPLLPASRAIRPSTMLEGNLIHRVQPEYPYPAKVAHVQGQVVLYAIISKEGTIENLHVVTGHPLLVGAAIQAVTRWRYRPYILNGEPVEVETQITVNFTLAGG